MPLDDLGQAFGRLSLAPLLLVLLLNIATSLLRALRFQLLLSLRGTRVSSLTAVVLLCNLLSNVVPARLGDLSYPAFFLRNFGTPIAHSLPALFLARIFDLGAVATIFLASALFAPTLPPIVQGLIRIVGISLLVLVLLAGIGVLTVRTEMPLGRSCTRFIGWAGTTRVGCAIAKYGTFQEASCVIKRFASPVLLIAVGAISLGIWLSMYLVGFVILRSLGVAVDIATSFAAQSLTLVTVILPLNSIGGFGSFEGSWVAAFVLLGVPAPDAITSGVVSHLIVFAYQVLLGLISLPAVNSCRSKHLVAAGGNADLTRRPCSHSDDRSDIRRTEIG